jgi:GH35 family endo-1,4-beta-xylanase
MGQLRFRIHDRDRIAPGGLDRIYVTSMEEIPWSTRTSWSEALLLVERTTSQSGCVSVPWKVGALDTRILSTSTLMERSRPYQLEVELARGLLHRTRSRLFLWELQGFTPSESLKAELQGATREFSLAATSQQEPAEAAVAANRAITAGIAVADGLVAEYAKQAIAARKQQAPISTLIGVHLPDALPSVEMRRQLVDACNIVQLPISWRAIEQYEGQHDWSATDAQLAWAQKAGLKVAAGPLLRLDDLGMPDWMVLWEDNFDSLAKQMVEHVRAVVTRYTGRVHLWHVASRVNTGKLLSLEEEQRLQLVAMALEAIRKIDPRTPTVVSFDQPWAEYLAHQDEDLAPQHYADTLVRADLGVSGLGLEINAGFYPGGSGHRPGFELGRLLDQWSIWGLPLMVSLTTASAMPPDPLARSKAAVEMATTDLQQAQHQWASSVLPLLLARNTVQVILWNQLNDHLPHELPHAGLFDAEQQPKPTLALIRELRKNCGL